MKIETVATESLKPYALNNKKHPLQQVERIALSIERYGFNNPIIIDKNDCVVAGHGRLEAAKMLGLQTVPCVRVSDLTDKQVRAYRILDNKLAEQSEDDLGNLEIEVLDLSLDLKEWGISLGGGPSDLHSAETPRANHVSDILEDNFDADAAVESGEVSNIVALGDVVTLGRHVLYCGDCKDAKDVFTSVGAWDILVTDPPYGISYTGRTKDALTILNDELTGGGLRKFLFERFDSCFSFGKKGSAVYVFAPSGPPLLEFLAVFIEKKIFRQCLVWAKDRFVLAKSGYHYKHEMILYGWVPGAPHFALKDRTKSTVWEFDRPKVSREHPTMKPIALVAEAILNSSNEGDLVFDPFMGSGTTLLASEQTGRRAIGCELSPQYASVIVERYRKHCQENGFDFVCTINGVKHP